MQLYGKARSAALGLLSCAVLAVGASACSGNAGGAAKVSAGATTSAVTGPSPVVAQAAAAVAKAEQPDSQWPGPTTSVKAVRGKTLGILSCTEAGSGCSNMAAGATAAAEALGWRTILVDGKGDPSTITNGFQQLLQAKVDAIVEAAIDYPLVQTGLTQAKDQGIPVACVTCGNPPGHGSMEVSDREAEAGKIDADYMIAATKGTAKVAILQDNAFGVVRERMAGLKAELTKCSGCSLADVIGVTPTDIATQAYNGVRTLLSKYPNGQLNYIVMSYDASVAGAVRALQDTGRSDVKLIGFDATPQGISAVQAGYEAADYATPLEWNGWEAVDQILRTFNRQPLFSGAGDMPGKLIVASNAPASGQFHGDLDFTPHFTKLWELVGS